MDRRRRVRLDTWLRFDDRPFGHVGLNLVSGSQSGLNEIGLHKQAAASWGVQRWRRCETARNYSHKRSRDGRRGEERYNRCVVCESGYGGVQQDEGTMQEGKQGQDRGEMQMPRLILD